MNAIIALCHFCEQHGPRVLFCTQPFHEQESLRNLIPQPISADLESVASGSTRSKPRLVQRSTSLDSDITNVTEGDGSSSVGLGSKDRCEGCRSLQTDKPGYISNDKEAKVRYVSSQQPHQDELYSIVRQACIRSLSSEVCPGREGPIFFGDSDTRYVISYTFHLSDTKSRGGRRLYSIIVVMMDKIYLLNSWPFLVKHLRNIVRDMQAKCKTVFETEERICPSSPTNVSISSLIYVKRSQKMCKERSYTSPTQMRLQSKNGSAVRSLLDMTNDPTLFRSLHLAFTWVLKACSNRLTEKMLEGPPTEDSIVDLERKEVVTEDDFVMVGTQKIKVTAAVPSDLTSSANSESVLGAAANSCTLTEDSLPDYSPIFHNLRELYQKLGYHAFHQLAHHVLIGNQIIVQSDSKRMTQSIIDCFTVLLPNGCCKVIYFSDTYEESWRCNFLGLSQFCALPKHVEDSEEFALISVTSPVPSNTVSALTLNELERYEICLRTGKPPMDRSTAPKILEKMERAIANMKLNWGVVEQCLTCIKEEWMNKVKVLFTFTKAGGNRSDDDTKKLLQVFGASDEDKKALKFWMTGLSSQYKHHMRLTSNQL